MAIKFIKSGADAASVQATGSRSRRSVAHRKTDALSRLNVGANGTHARSVSLQPRIQILSPDFKAKQNASTVNDGAEPTPLAMVPRIISILEPTYYGFVRASQLYNYEFFVGETSEFKVSLIQQLCMLYPKFHNSFWTKVMLDHSVSVQEPETI